MSSDADIKRSAAEFAESVSEALAQFHRLVPPASNPELTSRFLEELVRSLIENRLAPRRLLAGTFGAPGLPIPEAGPPPAQGIVYDPRLGPTLLERGGFSIVNPATCVGVIQIKPSAANILKFQLALKDIAKSYFRGRRPGMVMGVLVSDAHPSSKAIICRNGKTFLAHEFTDPKWCPIFILFLRRDDIYEPHTPAIEALLANIRHIQG